MRVSSSEGLANHTVPESCVGPREGDGEALTGVRIGWVLSRENTTPGTPTLCIERKATWTGASSRAPGRPGAVVDPHVRTLLAREPGDLASGQSGRALVRIGKVMSRSR